MRNAVLCAILLALATAVPAAASLPPYGSLVPGTALGGVRLDEPAASARGALGFHGVCRGCARPTWYFTYKPFDRHGLGVELTRGRVSAVYTLWQPAGWTGPRGLALGAFQGAITAAAGTLIPIQCDGYQALVRDAAHTRTAYYVYDGKLWGFGLFARGSDPCR
jgi:hypothetical protein